MQRARMMGRRIMASRKSTALCCVCAAAGLLAGCGGSGHTASTTRTVSTSSTPAAGTTPSGIRGQLLMGNELAGFTSAGVAVYTTAREWVSNPNDQQPADQAAAEKAMLTREGFKTGAVENLTGPAPDQGLSMVEQFRSPTAARAALAFYISHQKEPKVQSTDGTYAAFKISGIPGAVGFTLGGATGGANIAFTKGDSYYLIGREGGTPPAIARLDAAARHQYLRVAG